MSSAVAAAVAVMHGDQTGEELLQESLRVLDPDVTRVRLHLKHFDLSLAERRRTHNDCVSAAARAMVECGYGLKAATITPESGGDVGSPNAILRREAGGTVILRTGRLIPGVAPLAGFHSPVSVVRMAVGDAYGAHEWREAGSDSEVAMRTERITRRDCRAVAEFSFRHAARMGARVFGGPKFTVSPVYEGMLKEELDQAAARHPDVTYEPQLIDATYALLLRSGGDSMVIPALNRDGDCLSDLVLGMFGSIAGAESVMLGFDEAGEVRVVMAEAPHGTAPALEGKNLANPMAMILAGASLLTYMPGDPAQRAARAIYEATLETVRGGRRTADLGGHASTSEFTDAVIEAVRAKLDVWSALGGSPAR
jgi:isocitrate/isopropylmalate dehydrogenase